VYQNCCKKCGSISLHTEVKGNNTGLYCDDCGAFQKWLGKDELRAFNHAKSIKEINHNMRDVAPEERESVDGYVKSISKPTGNNFYDSKNMITRLKEFVEFLNKKIDSEYEKMPISNEDAIRKNAYCFALQQDIWALENILSGKDWNYKGYIKTKMDFENDIRFSHEETKILLDKPYVVLVENDDDDELRINGESVCCHKRLYPYDVLDALKNQGIINFTYNKEL